MVAEYLKENSQHQPLPPNVGMLKRFPPQVGYSSGPGGIRTLDVFSAIEEQVGEKGENAVHYVYYVPI
jgi:hypothetical protein